MHETIVPSMLAHRLEAAETELLLQVRDTADTACPFKPGHLKLFELGLAYVDGLGRCHPTDAGRVVCAYFRDELPSHHRGLGIHPEPGLTDRFNRRAAFVHYVSLLTDGKLAKIHARSRFEGETYSIAAELGFVEPRGERAARHPLTIMPAWLARIFERLFDSLHLPEAQEWGMRFFGRLSQTRADVPLAVYHRWASGSLLPLTCEAVRTVPGAAGALAPIERMIALHAAAAAGTAPGDEERRAALAEVAAALGVEPKRAFDVAVMGAAQAAHRATVRGAASSGRWSDVYDEARDTVTLALEGAMHGAVWDAEDAGNGMAAPYALNRILGAVASATQRRISVGEAESHGEGGWQLKAQEEASRSAVRRLAEALLAAMGEKMPPESGGDRARHADAWFGPSAG